MCPSLFEIVQATICDLSQSSSVSIRGYIATLPTFTPGNIGYELDRLVLVPPYLFDTECVAAFSLLKRIGKVWVGNDCAVPIDLRKQVAVNNFHAANARCEATNAALRSLPALPRTVLEDLFLQGLGEAQSFVTRLLWWVDDDGFGREDVPLRDLFVGLRTGPGASNGSSGNSFPEKIVSGPLAFSNLSLARFYRLAIGFSPRTFDADGNERPTLPELPTWERCELKRELFYGTQVISGSKFHTVPKSWKRERGIAIEPAGNMLFQLSLGNLLADSLSRFGLDLQGQQFKNRRLARHGSIHDDLVTVDLEAASDSVSIELVRRLFPKDWFHWFMLTRSPEIEISGETVRLNMISSMGNGYTFPLETIIFLSLVYAAFRLAGAEMRPTTEAKCGNWGVYGDDMIVPTDVYPYLRFLLDQCGFLINHEKSYFSGPFRESCGGDYHKGVTVRGVQCTTAATQQDVYSFINRLLRWGTEHGVSFPLTCSLLLSQFKELHPVPLFEADDAGLHVPSVLATKIYSGARLSESLKVSQHSLVYEIFSPRKAQIPIFDRMGAIHRHWDYNPDGVLLSILRGVVTGRYVNLRPVRLAYDVKLKATPGWDGGRLDYMNKFMQFRDRHTWRWCVTSSLASELEFRALSGGFPHHPAKVKTRVNGVKARMRSQGQPKLQKRTLAK